MFEFIKGFVFGTIISYIVISFIHEELWGQRFMNFIQFPYLMLTTLLEIVLTIVLFPFVFLWKLFRHVIRPVESERIQNLKLMDDSTHLFGSIYFCHDKTAKRLVNKCFFYRIIRS